MKTIKTTLTRILRKTGALGAAGAAIWSVALVAMVLVALGTDLLRDNPTVPLAAQADPHHDISGWGAEALWVLKDSAQTLSPIPLANACGLGASSCFRCHSGRRADEPKSDPVEAPWHHDHNSVNYSCAGCHQGNPRILREEIAHRGLIANPVLEHEQSCVSCHGAENARELAERYGASHPYLIKGHP